jgi:hypothetical protein
MHDDMMMLHSADQLLLPSARPGCAAQAERKLTDKQLLKTHHVFVTFVGYYIYGKF